MKEEYLMTEDGLLSYYWDDDVVVLTGFSAVIYPLDEMPHE